MPGIASHSKAEGIPGEQTVSSALRLKSVLPFIRAHRRRCRGLIKSHVADFLRIQREPTDCLTLPFDSETNQLASELN